MFITKTNKECRLKLIHHSLSISHLHAMNSDPPLSESVLQEYNIIKTHNSESRGQDKAGH